MMYSKQIKEITDMGVEVSIVIGGGNIFEDYRINQGVDRVTEIIWVCLQRL